MKSIFSGFYYQNVNTFAPFYGILYIYFSIYKTKIRKMVIHLFGNILRELRKQKNISQEELGELFGVAKTTVSNWENNINKPDIELVKQIAQYFGVTTDYLLGFNQEDRDNIERLKIALKEAGMLNGENEDMTKEDLEKALQIVTMLKEKKDTNK